MRRALFGLALGAASARGEETRGLQEYGCPSLDKSPYTSDPSPFGWPLTPNDWSFEEVGKWPEKYMVCGGERQSPIDITLNSASCSVDTKNENGALKHFANYLAGSKKPEVRISSYLRTAVVEGSFGTLSLRDPTGIPIEYEAVQLHLTTKSLHSIDGKLFDAELLIFHKPRGEKNMLKDGLVVSVLFHTSNVSDSPVFNAMGFTANGKRPDGASWQSKSPIDLPGLMDEPLTGASYQYNGSVPVPPCTENIKYIVLEKALPVGASQLAALTMSLDCWAGGTEKRGPRPNPYLTSCRAILKNSVQVGRRHDQATCQVAKKNGTWARSAVCWDLNADPECVKSPIDFEASMAGSADETAPLFNFKPVRKVRVSADMHHLDAEPLQAGVHSPVDNFGTIMVNGRKFLIRKLTVKTVSSHTYGGEHHAGEIQIEAFMFGDGFNQSLMTPHSAPGHRRLTGLDAMHRVMLSVPLKLGTESALIRELGLPFEAYKTALQDGHHYDIESTVDLEAGIRPALEGPWLWYKGGSTEPGCPKWGIRWLLFQTPVEVSIAQLNYLALRVSGMDSTRIYGPDLTPAEYREQVFSMSLPKFAVDYHSTCDPDTPWNYDDVHCWSETFPACSEGKSQSPINIIRSEVTKVGKDNFLHHTDWRPVTGLHVTNTGHGLQVTNDQIGWITMTGDDGFPEFYDAAQFHLHMPSEHMIDGRQYAAELHVVHRRQRYITQEKNSYDAFPLVVTAFFFDIGESESNFLKQFYLGERLINVNSFLTAKNPIDLMRSLGPAIDSDFYRYDGSFTTPDCHEQVQWFVFDHVFSMSAAQWNTFKAMYPSPNDNRPVQPINGRVIAKNSFEDGTPAKYDFFLGRHKARNRFKPGEFWIIFPAVGSLTVMTIVMLGTFVRESIKKQESGAGGLTETIGRESYNRM